MRSIECGPHTRMVPVIFCRAGERKHRIAEQYLAGHEVGIGVFLVLVAKAPAPVWKVARSPRTGAIVNIKRRREYVNHYSFQCAMRHSVVSPTQLGRTEGRFLGLMAYPMSKG
jgi:hypothetical protein